MLRIGQSELCPQIVSWFELFEYAMHVPGAPGLFWLRTRGTDQDMFRRVFLEGEYLPRRPFPSSRDVAVVIDAGAGIGCATLWFRLRFPKARIIAIEPDPASFERLQRNCGHLPGVELLQCALWGEDTELDLQFEAEGEPRGSHGTRTLPVGTSAEATARTPAYTMDTLMKRFGIERIDYARLDIAGAEKAVLESRCRDWLTRTRLLAAEFHDRFMPGCTAAAEKGLAGLVKTTYRRGETSFYQLA